MNLLDLNNNLTRMTRGEIADFANRAEEGAEYGMHPSEADLKRLLEAAYAAELQLYLLDTQFDILGIPREGTPSSRMVALLRQIEDKPEPSTYMTA